MRSIISTKYSSETEQNNYEVQFKLINTFELTELFKQVRNSKKHPVILIQKLLLNFQTGGKRLSVYYNKGSPLAIEVTNKFHPNFQIPLPAENYDVEEHWKFKIKKIDIEAKKTDRMLTNSVSLLTQLTHVLR